MRVDCWIRLGVLSLAVVGTSVNAADHQRWRPSAEGFTAGMPMAPMPPAALPGYNDPRFRPVPQGNFLRPPPPPPAPIYPGRPFVSVEGQYLPPTASAPAFVKQYAWRPADRPMDVAPRRQEVVASHYPSVAAPPMYGAPYPIGHGVPYPMGHGGHYAGAYGFPAPMGMLPPPPYPMPFPGAPFMAPGMFPPAPYAGAPGMNMFGYQPYGLWPPHSYMSRPPIMGHPSYSAPWVASWRGAPSWNRPTQSYSDFRSETPAGGDSESAYPIAGLY